MYLNKPKKIKNLKSINNYRWVSLVALLFFSISISFAQTDKGVVADKIIAKVDNYIVLKSDLEKAYLEFLSRGEISGGNAKCEILESLIINKMMVAKADIDSVLVDDIEVEANLENRLRYMVSQIGSESAIEKYYNKTMDQFKEELRSSVKEQLIVQKMQQTITEGLTVTPSEVKRFFNQIPKDSLPYFSTEVAVAQIVKYPTVSKVQKNASITKLTDLRSRILNGESFEVLAKEFSQEPGADRTGGSIGFFKRGELAPEYEAAALKLRPGEISMPVETDFGFHLIQLIERRGNEFNTRHILLFPISSSSDVDETVSYLDSLRSAILSDTISFEKAAKEYSDDNLTASNGGFFADASGASRVSVEELDPVIFFTIDTMKVGTITKPMVFRTDDGKDAVRILYFKDKVRPHQANLLDDYQKIRMAALNQKKNKILNEWFEKAQDDVFIDIDPDYNQCKILGAQ